jgi:hypothetical protein
LSKPNALSKRALGQENKVSEGATHKVMETMRIKEEPPINDEIQPIETFVQYESATDFKSFEALMFLTSMTNCFAPMFKRKLDKSMMNCDNRLIRFNKTITN